jgi:hypothetical protein
MWTTESAQLGRAVRVDVKSYTARTYWTTPHSTPYGKSLGVDPLLFLFAIERTCITAGVMDAQSKHASKLLGDVAMAFLTHKLTPPSLGTLHIHHNLLTTKDFVGTSIKGIIGAAMGYLEMQNLGYAWQGHWEDCVPAGGAGPQPDFIFAKSTDVCLVDAKGSTSSRNDLIKRAKTEWTRQIRPNLIATLIGGGQPTEGRIIGARLHWSDAAELITAYGKVPPAIPISASVAMPGSGGYLGAVTLGAATVQNTQRLPDGVASVQRINYATACNLIGLNNIGQQLMNLNELADRRQQNITLGYLNSTIDTISSGRRFGSSHLRYLGDGSVWKLTPFIVERVLERVVRKFIGSNEILLQANDGGIRVTHGTMMTTIEATDGVGIQFQLISQGDD